MMQKLGFNQDYDADQVLAKIADVVPFLKGVTRERLGKLAGYSGRVQRRWYRYSSTQGNI